MACDSDSDSDIVTNAITCVFWDLEDFPVPSGGNINSFPIYIRRSLYIMGYDDGRMSFKVYSGKQSKSSQSHLCQIEMGIPQEADEKCRRLNVMLLDMITWACDNRPSDFTRKTEVNFVVIAKDIPKEKTDFAETLRKLKKKVSKKVCLIMRREAHNSVKRQKTSEDADSDKICEPFYTRFIFCSVYENLFTKFLAPSLFSFLSLDEVFSPEIELEQSLFAFVTQEDLFFSQLTVRETVSLAVELQLPEISSTEERDEFLCPPAEFIADLISVDYS